MFPTGACFVTADSLPFSTRVNRCAIRFSSMAILKLSNWSACRYIRSDLGRLGAKYDCVVIGGLSLFKMSLYPKDFCGSKWRKVLGKKSTSL